jgi:hypothetical protein
MVFDRSNDRGKHYNQKWAEYAAEEARRKQAIPRHVSPRTVQVFFDNLFPDVGDSGDESEDAINIIEECNLVEGEETPATPVVAAATATATVNQTAPKVSKSSKAPLVRFSDAQMEHIRKYRRLIDASQCQEFFKDWKNVLLKKATIGPKKEPVEAEDYYIRSSAVWVPHLIIPDYHPICPCCKSASNVHTSKATWIQYPMLCYAHPLQKYLDTVNYPCSGCKKTFRGTNLDSMALDDSGLFRAIFRFRILRRCAVEEELFLDIVKRPLEPTNSIFQHLRSQAAQVYINDVIEFLVHAKFKNIRLTKSQRSISSYATAGPPADAINAQRTQLLQTKRHKIRIEMLSLEGQVEILRIANDDIEFDSIAKKKEDRKKMELAGFANNRIQKLANAGIHTARQLLAEYHSDNSTAMSELKKNMSGFPKQKEDQLKKWIDVVEIEFQRRKMELHNKLQSLESINTKLVSVENELSSIAQTVPNSNEDEVLIDGTNDNGELPTFSKFQDRKGYNARFLSCHLIEDVQQCYFQWRKPLMLRKIMARVDEVFSMDTNYKTARRVVVYKKGVGYFKPYIGYVTILGKFSQLLYWKVLVGEESINALKQDLIRLKARHDKFGVKVKLIYVDNCCTVRKLLLEIFPDATICLDEYHWMARWDEIFVDKSSPEAAQFRGVMRRVLNVVANDEYETKKHELQEKLRRKPSVKEILKGCNTNRPPAEDITKGINVVLNFFELADLERSTIAANAAAEQEDGKVDDIPTAKLVLRARPIVRKRLTEQLKHVKCLIPPRDVILHYKDSKNNILKVGQSSKNELLHKHANAKVFPGTRVGILKADRMMWSYLDQRDEMENVVRRNVEDTFTSNIESKAVANSLAADVGYQAPFQDVTLPGIPDTDEEMGFDLNCIDDPEEEFNMEMEAAANDNESEDDDVYQDEGVMEQVEQEETERTVVDQIDSMYLGFQAVLGRNITSRTNTFDAYYKMTGGKPMVPFHIDGEDTTSKEEMSIFHEMSKQYSRTVAPGHKDGYNTFLCEWELLAGKRRDECLTDDSAIMVYRKSLRMLQDCHDELKSRRVASLEATEEAKRRNEGMRTVFRDIRTRVMAPNIGVAEPESFPMEEPEAVPPGDPFALNPSVAMASVGRKRNASAPLDIPVSAMKYRRVEPETNMNQKIKAKKLPEGVTFNIICKVCGRKRSEHGGSNLFGSNCPFRNCGRCGETNPYHEQRKLKMGYFCRNPIAEERAQKYETTVKQMARQKK